MAIQPGNRAGGAASSKPYIHNATEHGLVADDAALGFGSGICTYLIPRLLELIELRYYHLALSH